MADGERFISRSCQETEYSLVFVVTCPHYVRGRDRPVWIGEKVLIDEEVYIVKRVYVPKGVRDKGDLHRGDILSLSVDRLPVRFWQREWWTGKRPCTD